MSWLLDLSKRWHSASYHFDILEKLAADISPTLAQETIFPLVIKKDEHSSSSSSSSQKQLPNYPIQNLADLQWNGPKSLGVGQSLVNDSERLKVRSVDSFWNEMPIREDHRKWNTFTKTFFT